MADIPTISGRDMAEVDRFMMQEMGIDTLQLMELAGYAVADAIRRHAGIDLRSGPRIIAMAGTGGNGGDAMVAARLLAAWGARPTVALVEPQAGYSGIAAHQLAILDRMAIPLLGPSDLELLPGTDLIVDGLLGFSLKGDPRGEAARFIQLANESSAPVVAIDLPSGLDATSGYTGSPCIRAAMTVTLALPKTGLMMAPHDVTGDIWLADIGVPAPVYDRFGVSVPETLFSHGSLIRVSSPCNTGH